MRKIVMILGAALFLTTSAYADHITLNINDTIVSTPVAPIQEAGTTLVPLRIIGENLGATLEWDGPSQTVTITKGVAEIKLIINSKRVSVNNVKQELLAAPKLIKGTTMVPIRFISENLDGEVDWDGPSRTVFVRDKVKRYFTTIQHTDQEGEEYYEGEVIMQDGNEIPDGEGDLVLKGGEIYSGFFRNGHILHGILIYPNGEIYEGEFEHRKPQGNGRYFYDNMAYYEGEFWEGEFNGWGRVTFEDGDYYEGWFKQGEFMGE